MAAVWSPMRVYPKIYPEHWFRSQQLNFIETLWILL